MDPEDIPEIHSPSAFLGCGVLTLCGLAALVLMHWYITMIAGWQVSLLVFVGYKAVRQTGVVATWLHDKALGK
jgi:hypothetical protein